MCHGTTENYIAQLIGLAWPDHTKSREEHCTVAISLVLQHPHLEILFVASVPKSLGGCPGDALITSFDEEIGLIIGEDETLHCRIDSHQQGARPPLKTGAGDAVKKIIAGAFFWCTTWCTAH